MRPEAHGLKKIGGSPSGSFVKSVGTGGGLDARGVEVEFVLWNVWEYIRRNALQDTEPRLLAQRGL